MARNLSPERIVDDALDLLQERGLAKVSVNEVARRLDVGVASLYWHVANKGELLRLMTERIYAGCLESLPDGGSWQDWLVSFGLSLWEAQSRVRDARLLIMTVHVPEATKKFYDDRIVEELVLRGLARESAGPVQHSVQALVTGWTALRLDEQSAGAHPVAFRQALDHLVAGWGRSGDGRVSDTWTLE